MSDQFAQYEEKLLGMIREFGWAVQYVMSGRDSAAFSYTVGLSGFNAPELIIAGLNPEVSRTILNSIAGTVKDGKRWSAGDRTSEFLTGGTELTFIDVADSTQDLTMANRIFLTAAPVPALQVVWPDTKGRFPWEPDWSMGAVVQPLRGTPPTPT